MFSDSYLFYKRFYVHILTKSRQIVNYFIFQNVYKFKLIPKAYYKASLKLFSL